MLRGLALAAAVSAAACSDPATQFTGIWKSNCENYWGVQIRPAERGFYSVTFCGLSGCLQPGDWMPNTRIEGDPGYQVVSSTSLRIQHDVQDHFEYRKCSDDPSWQSVPSDPAP